RDRIPGPGPSVLTESCRRRQNTDRAFSSEFIPATESPTGCCARLSVMLMDNRPSAVIGHPQHSSIAWLVSKTYIIAQVSPFATLPVAEVAFPSKGATTLT